MVNRKLFPVPLEINDPRLTSYIYTLVYVLAFLPLSCFAITYSHISHFSSYQFPFNICYFILINEFSIINLGGWILESSQEIISILLMIYKNVHTTSNSCEFFFKYSIKERSSDLCHFLTGAVLMRICLF